MSWARPPKERASERISRAKREANGTFVGEWAAVSLDGSDCNDVAISIGPDARAMIASRSFAAAARDCSTVAALTWCAGGIASLTIAGETRSSRQWEMDSRSRDD